MRRFRWLGAVLVVVAITAAACGDDDDSPTISGGQTDTTAARPSFAGSSAYPVWPGSGKRDSSSSPGLPHARAIKAKPESFVEIRYMSTL